MNDEHLAALARYVYEVGYLKRLPRTGWNVAGVAQPESVAEHSFRTAVIGVLLAHLEGADPGVVAVMSLLHDTQETRIGDVPHVGRRYVTTAANEGVSRDQMAGFPDVIRAALVGLVGEYEARESLESSCAKDADKIECLVQAREYEEAGNGVMQAWIDSSVAALRTSSGKRLAALCLEIAPREWWERAARDCGG